MPSGPLLLPTEDLSLLPAEIDYTLALGPLSHDLFVILWFDLVSFSM